MTVLDLCLGVFAAFWFLCAVVQRAKIQRLAARASRLEAEAGKAAAAPLVAEQRIDRYELLWFASVTYSPSSKTVEKVSAGMPHCRQCVAALRLDGKEWTCPECKARRPETVADIMVIDSVEKEAARQFLERHREYRLRTPA